jgi:hypothetical protein
MLWTLNVDGFREECKRLDIDNVKDIILCRVSHKDVAPLSEMARTAPEERASAAQMIVKCFGGEGLSTPPTHIPPFPRTQDNGLSQPSTRKL